MLASMNKPLNKLNSTNGSNGNKTNNMKSASLTLSPFAANTSFKNMGSSPSIVKSMNASMNGTVNTIKTSLSDAFSPVKDSINQSMENNTSMLTVPVMLGLGILVIALIIIIMFRNQVAYMFEVAWSEVKKLFKPSHEHREHREHREYKEHEHEEHKSHELKNAPLGTHDGVGNKPHVAKRVDHGAIHSMSGGKQEVFNIADNKYKYSDAEPLCKAYGAELATYDQVKEAWQKGADWCNYGWVKGQAAVYPTQESTYNKLQAGPEDQKRACGVTGVNGGYFDNPNLRFGVNCYGAKPAKSDADDRAQMKHPNQTNDQLEYDRKVQDYKTELNIIPISPFNTESWE
jgi:hypothetical protein